MQRSTVVIELAGDTSLSRDLAAGGVFVPGCRLRIAEECDLVVCRADRRVSLPARVVYVDEHRGAGLELIGFSTAMREQLAELAPDTEAIPSEPLAAPGELGGDAPSPAASPDGDLAVPEIADDDHRTVPVSTSAVIADDLALPSELETGAAFAEYFARPAASPAQAADDIAPPAFEADAGMAVPVALEGDDDHRTVPVQVPADRAAAFQIRFSGSVPGDDSAAATESAAAPEDFASEPTIRTRPGSDVRGDDADSTGAEHGDRRAEAAEDELAWADLAGDHAGTDSEAAPFDADDEASAHPAGVAEDPESEAGDERQDSGSRAPRNVHERLRGLTLAAQIKLATGGEQHERIVLERLYGKNVWETLLRNPRLTAPEVSRIARYGSLPRVLLEIIVGNNAWLQIPEVRRALLSNPRLGADQIMKVLRLVPKHELRLAAIQTAYPHAVRSAAKMLLQGE